MAVRYKIIFAVLCAALLTAAVWGLAGMRARTAAATEPPMQVPIILYHEIKTFNNNRMAIAPYEFENDLAYLQRSGYTTITMTDLIRYVDGAEELPKKPIILTFDDGYLNNYVYALPLLEKYHMKAVLSIIAKNTDDFTQVPDKNLDYSHVTWTQLAEMHRSGCFEVQNHTYNLHLLSAKRKGCLQNPGESAEHYEQVLVNDLTRCQSEILENIGTLPNTFTYPYGKISPASLPIIRSIGFRASLSCKYGINLIARGDTDGLYCLMRISRYHNVSMQKTLSDALKTLKFSKKYRAAS